MNQAQTTVRSMRQCRIERTFGLNRLLPLLPVCLLGMTAGQGHEDARKHLKDLGY